MMDTKTIPNSTQVHHSARLIVIDPSGRLLLFQYQDEHCPTFLATIGGKLQPGEGYLEAAARELFEETGVQAPIGRFLRERDDIYAVAGYPPARWIERYYLVQLESVISIQTQNWTDEEQSTIQTWRWWSLADMKTSQESFKPEWLPELLAQVNTNNDKK